MRLEVEIVGNEALAALAQKFFDDRMTAADDQQFAAGGEFGTDVAAVGGELCERGEHVHLRDGGGGLAQAHGVRGDAVADVDEELAFDFSDALVGGEDFALVFFQFGSGEAFGVDESLLALVVGGREMQIGFRDFDVVAEDAVEADL